MSTRSNIYLKLNNESKGQTIKLDKTKLPSPLVNDVFETPDLTIPQDANFIGVYHHWDGYVTGVGKTLFENYKDYETILNLLVLGDFSTINGDITAYHAWRNENTPPKFYTDKTLSAKKAVREEYAYLFDGKKWKVAYFKWDDETDKRIEPKWLDLETELKRLESKE